MYKIIINIIKLCERYFIPPLKSKIVKILVKIRIPVKMIKIQEILSIRKKHVNQNKVLFISIFKTKKLLKINQINKYTGINNPVTYKINFSSFIKDKIDDIQ